MSDNNNIYGKNPEKSTPALHTTFRINPIRKPSAELLQFCFEKWVDLGSIRLVLEYAEKNGVRGVLNKPLRDFNVRMYAETYITNNPEKAREYYLSKGVFDDDNDWITYIITLGSKHFHNKQSFISWTVKNKLYKPGFHLFKKTYNLSDDEYTAFDSPDDKQE